MNEPLEATLRRLKTERDDADRRYNDALTALDRAAPAPPALGAPLAPFDASRVPELNGAWNILPQPPAAAGLKGKLTGYIWRTIGPYLQRQLTFNSILVDHINRNVERQERARVHEEQLAAELRSFADQVTALHNRLMLYLQQITAYVDTKDRDVGGGILVLNAALSGMAEAQAKYRETLQAREHRYEAKTTALAQAHEELRGMLAVAQQALSALRRHVENTAAVAPAGAAAPLAREAGAPSDAFAPALDAYKYVGFEDQFRGSRDVIRERQESYVPLFAGGAGGGDVLDVGCGRGEFIELLQRHGIPARGIDVNHEMAETCRARGLKVEQADAVAYLSGLDDGSLGGIFAAQVVEHLEPAYLLRFLDLAFAKLSPAGTLVLETLNPACWTAFFESYIRDITHRWPLHPDTLKYLVTASGFTSVSVEFKSPVAAADKLQLVPLPLGGDPVLHESIETLNGNMHRLNRLMFGHMDYAVIARKS